MGTAVATAVLAASLALLAPSYASAAPVYTFVNFDVPGATGGTTAFGINNAGQVVGISSILFEGRFRSTQGFLRDQTGSSYTTLSGPPGTNTYAYGINDAGQIVGSYGFQGFVRDPASGSYTTLVGPAGTLRSRIDTTETGFCMGYPSAFG